MPSTALYTDIGRVVEALAFQSPETLQAAVGIGALSITLSTAPPADWQVGASLVLDSHNPALRETVTITAPPNGSIVSISATLNAHVVGAPVVNGTVVGLYVSAASRWFDSQTYVRSGFDYGQVTDSKTAYQDGDGYIVVPLSKPVVALGDVTSATFQPTPISPVDTLDLTKAWVTDDYFLRAVPFKDYNVRRGIAVVTYKGGYNPVPDDIVLAVTMMAARFYKERDSGYSDVIGSADTGILQYKKAMPADVACVVAKYRRWTE